MRRAGLVLLILLLASPALAVREWYDYYDQAVRRDIPAGRYQDAIQALQAAIRLKSTSGLNEQTYGLQFVDYLPYYWQGRAYYALGDYASAERAFTLEEAQGAVRKSSVYPELKRMRADGKDHENQRVARLAREEVDRLIKEAQELARARKHDEALARLAEAQKAAAALDPQTQRRVQDLRDRLRDEETARTEAAARLRRIQDALAEGQKLLADEKLPEAGVRFDEVLRLDPQNAAAAEGRRKVQERILSSQTRRALAEALARGKSLVDAQRYEEALEPLTFAAADAGNAEARALLEKAQAVVERLRDQRDQAAAAERGLREADALLAAHRFSEAQVSLEEVLRLDPTSVRAREKLGYAERMVGEDILSRLGRPNLPPELTFFEPAIPETEMTGPSLSMVGIATDERGVLRVEFKQGDAVVARIDPAPAQSGDPPRNVPLVREFPLDVGETRITVVATDLHGLVAERTFTVIRRARWVDSRYFLPSAALSASALVGLGLLVQHQRRRRALRRRFNPYIAGAPVLDDHMFFGRERFLARILNVLHHNSLMITGERRIGKTTFLYHLRKALVTDEGTDYRFFPVFTDLQGVPEQAFFHAVMGDVVDGLDLLPATRAGLRYQPEAETDYDGRDFSHDLQRVIEDLKERTPRRVKLALLIDEVDVLNEYSERVNQRLRSIFMKTFSEHLVAVMSGVGIRRVWKSEGSPWYNFFDEIELTPFSREEAEALIREPVEGVFRWDADAVELVLAWSRLKPYLVQKLCIHALNAMLERDRTRVSVADVEAARGVLAADPDAAEAPEPVPV